MMRATKNGEIYEDHRVQEPVQNAATLRTVLLSAVVMAATMTVGNVSHFSSIALPQMELNQDEASWYMSLPSLASSLGTLFNALTLDPYGPRFNILVAVISNSVGWFLLAGQVSYPQMYLGRLFGGFALGACVLPSIVYVAESITVNNVRMRCTIGTWASFSIVIGGLLMYTLSLSLTYDGVAFVFGVLSTVSLISILIFIPESPAWLYEKGRAGDAEMAQQRLGIRQPSILRTRKVLPISYEKDDSTFIGFKSSELNSCSLKNVTQYLSQIRRPEVYKPTIITIAFKFFSTFSGIYCIIGNMVKLITVYPLKSDPYVLSLVSQAFEIIGCLLLTTLLPYFGAKIMSIISFLVVFVGQLSLALSILLENSSLSANIFNYIHILSVWVIALGSHMGMIGVSQSVLGELFPIGAKGYAAIPVFINTMFTFVNYKIFPYVFPRYEEIVFFVYAIVTALGAAFVAVFLPETVGKTMKEIEESFVVRSNSEGEDE